MSEAMRIPRADAIISVNIMLNLLNKSVEQGEVCGSYRRGRADVADIDMVIQPRSLPDWLAHTDSLVERGIVSRGKQAGGSESWGFKKRVIHFRRLNFDIAIATPWNYGYQKWLRTGPGEANTALMGMLKKHSSPIRMADGYLWHVTYHSSYVTDAKLGYHKLGRLNVPDEETFFMLLGMPMIDPARRDEVIYRRYIGKWVNAPDQEIIRLLYVNEEDFEAYQREQSPNPVPEQQALL